MIQDRVFKLKKAIKFPSGVEYPTDQEFSIVTDVVYVNGYMLPPAFQIPTLNWILNNPTLFDDVTRNW